MLHFSVSLSFLRQLAMLALGASLFVAPSLAQDLPRGSVATVNGVAITYDDIAMAEEELRSVIGQLPERQRFETLVSYMIDRVLAAQEATKLGLADSEAVAKRRAFNERKALESAYVSKLVMEKVSDDKIAAFYQKDIVNGPKQEQVRARHILVDSKEMAEAIIVSLKGGADFAQLAKEESKGPSGSGGGDLGYFDRAAMVAPFSEAAYKLEKGEISPPVKTQFGWHVIKLEDKRTKPTPKLETVRDQIVQVLVGEARQEIYENIRKGAQVDFVDVDNAYDK